MSKSVKKNYLYNLLYQSFLLIIPVAVTPYLSRVLGESGSGRYSFTMSISTYFTLFASLGFGYYAQRLIASHQGAEEAQAKDFWEVLTARGISCFLSLFLYFVLLASGVYAEKYRALLWIEALNVLAVAFDVAFFFQGNEQFGRIAFRNVAVRLVGFLSIFLFVKTEKHVGRYALIQALTLALGNLSLWVCLPKKVLTISKKGLQPLKHLLPTLLLFLPTIATSVYTTLDKTLIGVITGSDAENGNYEYAERLVKMALTVLTSLGAVMIPRNSERFAQGDLEGVGRNVLKTTKFALFLGVPLFFGLWAIADNLIPWYLGDGYKKAAVLVKLLSPLVLVIGLSNVFGLQYLIPSGNDKRFTAAIVTGAAVNLALNLCLIPRLQSYGAAVATVVAELAVTAMMGWFLRGVADFQEIKKEAWKYFLSGGVTFVPCRLLSCALPPSPMSSGLIVFVGALVYFLCLLSVREEFLLYFWEKVWKRLKEKGR